LQCLEPHLVDGVIVGNVDIDAMLAEQLKLPLQHANDAHDSDAEHSRDVAEESLDRHIGVSQDVNMEENMEENVEDMPAAFVEGP
jgi:hypothetical protein